MYYEYPDQKVPVILVPGYYPALNENPFDFSPPEGQDIKHSPVQFHPNSVWRKYEKNTKEIGQKPDIEIRDPRRNRREKFRTYIHVRREYDPDDGIPLDPCDPLTDGLGTFVYNVAIQTDESFNAFTDRLFKNPVPRCIRHTHKYYRFHKVYARFAFSFPGPNLVVGNTEPKKTWWRISIFDQPAYPDLPERVVERHQLEEHQDHVPMGDALGMPAINEEDEDIPDDDGNEPKSDNDANVIVHNENIENNTWPDGNQDDCKDCSPKPALNQDPIMCYDKCIQTRISWLMGNRIVDFDVPVPRRISPYPIDTWALDCFIAKMLTRTEAGRNKRALMLVFSYLRPEELLVASRVSRWWLHIALQKTVWKRQILDTSIDQVQVEDILKFAPCLYMVRCHHLYTCPQKWRIRDALLTTYCQITRYRFYPCISKEVERWSVRMMQKLLMTLEELELFDVSKEHLYYLEYMPNLRKLSVWSTQPVLFEYSDVKVGWAQLTHLKTNIHPDLTRSLLPVHCRTLQDITIQTPAPPPETDAQDSLLDLFLENTFPELLKVTIERYCLPLERASCDREIEALRTLLQDVEVETTPHTDDYSEKRRFYQELPKKPWEPPGPPPGEDWVYPGKYEPQPLNWAPLGHDEEYADEEAPANAG